MTIPAIDYIKTVNYSNLYIIIASVAYRGGVGEFKRPHPEIPKALQNRAKLNPIVKTVKNC